MQYLSSSEFNTLIPRNVCSWLLLVLLSSEIGGGHNYPFVGAGCLRFRLRRPPTLWWSVTSVSCLPDVRKGTAIKAALRHVALGFHMTIAEMLQARRSRIHRILLHFRCPSTTAAASFTQKLGCDFLRSTELLTKGEPSGLFHFSVNCWMITPSPHQFSRTF